MMKLYVWLLTAALMLIAWLGSSSPASAMQSQWVGITDIGCSNSSGTCSITINGTIPNPAGCGSVSAARLVMTGTGAEVSQSILSVALSAFVSGKEIIFFIDGCSNNQPKITYLHMR